AAKGKLPSSTTLSDRKLSRKERLALAGVKMLKRSQFVLWGMRLCQDRVDALLCVQERGPGRLLAKPSGFDLLPHDLLDLLAPRDDGLGERCFQVFDEG